MTDALALKNEKKIWLYRGNTTNGSLSSTQFLPATKLRLGNNQITAVTSTVAGLDNPLPIEDGTVLDDGSNTFTGSSGGDNSTSNTTTYKEGAGATDVTSQNLIANDTNATKIWTISNLASAGTNANATQYTSVWLYIKDSAALAKFLTSGTAVEIKLGSDASNYYSKTFTAANLATGWNWLQLGILNTNTETGTVGSPIDTFIIEITTNNATDEFVVGDVLIDLLRQWEYSDTLNSFQASFPTIDTGALEVSRRNRVPSTKANGFSVNSYSYVNEDSSPLTTTLITFDADSKTLTDEWIFVTKLRVKQ